MFAAITDTHCGARSSSSIFREYMKWWYDTQFFPQLVEKEITTILHLGDFFDSRNSITLADIDFIINWFGPRLIKDNFKLYVILGNHDVAYRNTNNIHSVSLLKSSAPNNVFVIDKPTTVNLSGYDKFVLVPWINNENYQDTFDYLNQVTDKANTIVAGHFEINGAKMSKHAPACDSGLDKNLFKEFKEVWSGHFHHKSKIDNIFYLGTPFKFTWEDYYDDKGYHIFNDGKMMFVKNDYHLFIEIEFDEAILYAMSKEEFYEAFSDRYVRIIINSEYDKVALLDILSRINNSKPHEVQIVNNYDLNRKGDKVETNNVLDSVTKTTKQYIDEYVSISKESSTVIAIMERLHNQAIEKMLAGEK